MSRSKRHRTINQQKRNNLEVNHSIINKRKFSGSETIRERVGKNIPWICGSILRKPKIRFPKPRYRRMTPPASLKSIVFLFVLIILFILQTGIVYLVYMESQGNLLSMWVNPDGSALFIHPDKKDSFIIEAIVASLLLCCSSLGFVLLYHASKLINNRNIAQRILAIGAVLAIISFIFLQYMMSQKPL